VRPQTAPVMRRVVMTALAVAAMALGAPAPAGAALSYVGQFGTAGSGPGALTAVGPIATAPDGSVYALDGDFGSAARRIVRYTPSGAFIAAFAGQTGAPESLQDAADLAVDARGFVYVTEPAQKRIAKFTAGGQLVDPNWAGATATFIASDPVGNLYLSWPGLTKLDDSGRVLFTRPSVNVNVLATDAHQQIYATSPTSGVSFDATGNFLGALGEIAGRDRPPSAAQFGSPPTSVTVTSDDTIWFNDPATDRLISFDHAGHALGACGAQLFSGSFSPGPLASTAAGDLYAGDANSIRHFTTSGMGKLCRDLQIRITHVRLSSSRFRRSSTPFSPRRGATLKFTVNQASTILVRLFPLRAGSPSTTLLSATRKAGPTTVRVSGWHGNRPLPPGTYKIGVAVTTFGVPGKVLTKRVVLAR